MEIDMAGLVFLICIGWTFIGFFILHTYEENSCTYNSSNSDFLCYLNPVWVWKNYKVNVIGCFFLVLLFNLICPLLTVIYWTIKLIGWICTVGRK